MHRESGFTLVEVLVAMVIAMVLMAGSYIFLTLNKSKRLYRQMSVMLSRR